MEQLNPLEIGRAKLAVYTDVDECVERFDLVVDTVDGSMWAHDKLHNRYIEFKDMGEVIACAVKYHNLSESM